MTELLFDGFESSVFKYADKTAIIESSGAEFSYATIHQASELYKKTLIEQGVMPGNRVLLNAPKCAASIVAILAILKAGAVYVPCGPDSPPSRNARVAIECNATAMFSVQSLAKDFFSIYASNENACLISSVRMPPSMAGLIENLELFRLQRTFSEYSANSFSPLACILYTSGSTGLPKGVMITHTNAVAFINWCSSTFDPDNTEHFLSYAPLSFDLSILDIFLAFKHGATTVLADDYLKKNPRWLTDLISGMKISNWYSTPTALDLVSRTCPLVHTAFPKLKRILFAGEVFPIAAFCRLQNQLPQTRFYNLYGPTETNVCTFYEITSNVAGSSLISLPIGQTCSHMKVLVCNERGEEIATNVVGELIVSGMSLSPGYWNDNGRYSDSFITTDNKQMWYRTGDNAFKDDNNILHFVGRKDRLVKHHGYRIELDEIERCIEKHHAIAACAVVVVGKLSDSILKAYITLSSHDKISTIDIRRHCAFVLPLHMIPQQFIYVREFPVTTSGKVDYQALSLL